MPGNVIRSFIAVPVPGSIAKAMANAAHEAFGDIDHIRMVNPRSMHLTLKFLGDMKKDVLDKIGDVLSDIACRRSSFAVKAAGIGAFPNLKNPKVLFVPLTGETEALIDMAARLEKALIPYGIDPEKISFKPHLTLGRVKAPKQLGLIRKRAKTFENVSFGDFRVEELILYRSDLRPEGARYTPLAGARLG